MKSAIGTGNPPNNLPSPRIRQLRQRIVDLESTLQKFLKQEWTSVDLSSLTRSETRLAIGLFLGQSIQEFAEEEGISINTARWHLKQIYAKTGVNRQTKLMHLLYRKSQT